MEKEEVQILIKQALFAEKRRQFKKKLFILASAVIFAPALIFAASIAIPNKFSDGDTLSAAKLNENFDTLLTKVNDLDAKVSKIKVTQLFDNVVGPLPVTTSSFTTSGGNLYISASGGGYVNCAQPAQDIGFNVQIDGVTKGTIRHYAGTACDPRIAGTGSLLITGVAAGNHTITYTVFGAQTNTGGQSYFYGTLIELP